MVRRTLPPVDRLSDPGPSLQDLPLKESRADAILDAAPDAMVGVDSQGTIVMVNAQAESLFGYERADLIGRSVDLLVPDQLRAIHLSHREGYFASPTVRPMYAGLDISGRRADGSEFPAAISLTSVETQQGALAVAAIRDITERKLAQEAIRLAKEEAVRANQAKGAFLSAMSHELRTPLNAILGFSQLLQMRKSDSEDDMAVAQILKAGHHLLDLIDEARDITSIDAGRLRLSLEPVDLGEVMKEALDLMRPLAEERDIAFEKWQPPSSLLVMADHQRLLQVILNLLSNAVKYNRRGGAISMTCESGNDTARVAVTDTGYGIASDKMSGLLFEPFERLGAETSDVEGTGLGLALSKSLIEAMGGRLGASSEPEIGSTFWFRLPIAADIASGQKASLVRGTPVVLPYKPADILYIEDNLSNLQLLQHVFGDRPQYKFMSAMQGRLGLQLARACRPDVILLDLHLPDIGGEEVLAVLQESADTKDIPVIVISADASPQTAGRVTSAGATAFIPKPLDLRQLLTAISEALT